MTDIAEAPKAARADRRDKSIGAAPNFDLLAGVSLRVSVEVGSTSMTLSELLALGEGSVIELDRAATDLLDIYANGTLIAKGEIVSVDGRRSEEHTSELQSLMRNSYAVFCLKKKNIKKISQHTTNNHQTQD